MSNPVCFWELASHDAAKTVEFLRVVFDWEISFDEESGLFYIPSGEARATFAGGGVFTLRRAKLPFLTIYIQVENIHAKAKLVEDNGGFIVEAPYQIPSGSWICLFNEPSGVTMALLQPAEES